LDYWERFFNHFDFVHLPEADYHIGPSRYVTFGHDWRRVGVADWLEVTAARELGEQVTITAPEPAAMLSHEEFASSVKQALRSLHQPQALLRNPLMASSMVQNELREHPDHRPDQVLRGLIINAAQVVKADPRAEAQYRVLDRTYLHPAPSQEKAAELLDLSFSTYRPAIATVASRPSPGGCGTATLITRYSVSPPRLCGGHCPRRTVGLSPSESGGIGHRSID
jgi:hypothetical protein